MIKSESMWFVPTTSLRTTEININWLGYEPTFHLTKCHNIQYGAYSNMLLFFMRHNLTCTVDR